MIWRPSPDYLHRSRLSRFMQRHGFPDYRALHERSIVDVDWFWRAALEEIGVEWARPFTRVLDVSEGIEWPHWFLGGCLNLVHTCVDKHAAGPRADRVAIR